VTHKAKPNVKCSECGTPVKRKPRELGKFVNFFCSDSCQSKFRLKEVGASADKITESRKRSQKKRLKKERGDICEVCNWSRGVCDVHHIVPVYKGGSELDSNLIILCPNCHRLAHLGQLVLDNRDL
jgi:predicted HNH restriction endonuclease